MSVTCTDCADSYDVEPDAFGDGCVIYYFNVTLEKLEEGEALKWTPLSRPKKWNS